MYRQDEPARLAKEMPRKPITVTQDETLPGGLCLVTMEPESTFILLAPLAQARDQVLWNALRAPALAQLNGEVMQSTSEEAPGMLASVEHYLEAPHAPDLFHGQHELGNAVSGPIAPQERAAHQAIADAMEQLDQLQTHRQSAGDEPAKRGPGRPPKAPVSLEHAEPALEAARRAPKRLAQHHEQVHESLRGIGHASHCVALERGVRRNGQLIAADIHEPIEHMRPIAQPAGLRQSCLERIEKAERVVPKMQATLAFVSG